jgi:hypothetical protein
VRVVALLLVVEEISKEKVGRELSHGSVCPWTLFFAVELIGKKEGVVEKISEKKIHWPLVGFLYLRLDVLKDVDTGMDV